MARRTAEQSAASTSTRCKQLAIFLLLNKADFMYRIVVQTSRVAGQTHMPFGQRQLAKSSSSRWELRSHEQKE